MKSQILHNPLISIPQSFDGLNTILELIPIRASNILPAVNILTNQGSIALHTVNIKITSPISVSRCIQFSNALPNVVLAQRGDMASADLRSPIALAAPLASDVGNFVSFDYFNPSWVIRPSKS